ncbi:hypothetical protein F0L74_08630 [Chitinophaga agrisoli]|uniref:Uncharacterized protein n=1 Tax=Chitinophaga agrisoli TaxID=2607653 RepID=A0A5B2VTP4_9BACT|nr:hypothetical protein [Chitinophaga agrisoli]KAA2242591.1 hypothetical protein F0L74_08630 [Chitinophaga agrisoli]
MRRKVNDPNTQSQIRRYSWYVLVLSIILGFVGSFMEFWGWVTIPLEFFVSIFTTLIALSIFFSSSNYLRGRNIIEPEVEMAVRNVFSSDSFLLAVTTVLPRGNRDEENGFDYIPFMLANLEMQRTRFKKNAGMFLVTTIVLSGFFVLIAIVFSYFLLDESSIGRYKHLNNLTSQLGEVSRMEEFMKRDISTNSAFFKLNGKNLDLLQNYTGNGKENGSDVARKVSSAITVFKVTGNIDTLYAKFQEIGNVPRDKLPDEPQYYEALVESTNTVAEYINKRNGVLESLGNVLSKTTDAITTVQKELQTPESQQSEMIKRLILSAVVLTFFLAVLRYFRGLYQNNYNQMLITEQQELMIRKFYVAYKSSEGNPEARKIVLQNFITGVQEPLGAKPSSGSRSNKADNDLLKEIIQAATRKL